MNHNSNNYIIKHKKWSIHFKKRDDFKHMTKNREKNLQELENKFQNSINEFKENKSFIVKEYQEINKDLFNF